MQGDYEILHAMDRVNFPRASCDALELLEIRHLFQGCRNDSPSPSPQLIIVRLQPVILAYSGALIGERIPVKHLRWNGALTLFSGFNVMKMVTRYEGREVSCAYWERYVVSSLRVRCRARLV